MSEEQETFTEPISGFPGDGRVRGLRSLDPLTHVLGRNHQLFTERLLFLNVATRLYPEFLEGLRMVFERHPTAWAHVLPDDYFHDAWEKMTDEKRDSWQDAYDSDAPLPRIKVRIDRLPDGSPTFAHRRAVPDLRARPQGWFAGSRDLRRSWIDRWRVHNDRWIIEFAIDTLRNWQHDPKRSRSHFSVNDLLVGYSSDDERPRIPILDFDPFMETAEQALERLSNELNAFKKNLKTYIRQWQAMVETEGEALSRKRQREHFEWTARHILGGETIPQIARSAEIDRPNISEQAIKKAIADVKLRIGLRGGN